MNILNTAHSKAHAAKTAEGGKQLLQSVGKSNVHNSKELLTLKQNPKYKNINFDHVLAAAKKGHDPEAMAKLLVRENHTQGKVTAQESKLPHAKQAVQQTNIPVIDSGTMKQPISKEHPLFTNQETQKSILNPMRERKAANLAYAQMGKPESRLTLTQQEPQVQTKAPLNENSSSSIFKTPRVLNIQAQSKFAGKAPIVSEQVAMSQMSMNSGAQVPTPKVSSVKTQDLVDLRQMKMASRAIPSKSYQTQSGESLVRNRVEAQSLKTQKNLAMDETSRFDNIDMGDNLNKFASTTFATVAATEHSNAPKIMNLNQLQTPSNSDAVINQIQDYVIQSQTTGKTEVSMSFEHQELGQVDLLVQKLDPKSQELNIQIATRGNQAAEFFKLHQGELVNTLNRSGLQIAELKLESANSNQQQELSQESSKEQLFQRGQKQHGSQSGERDADQSRRRELWSQFYGNKDAA